MLCIGMDVHKDTTTIHVLDPTAEVQVAKAGRIPWLFRDGSRNDRIDAGKLATLLARESNGAGMAGVKDLVVRSAMSRRPPHRGGAGEHQ